MFEITNTYNRKKARMNKSFLSSRAWTLLLAISLAVITLTGVTKLVAQEAVVDVGGRATDPSGAVVPDVSVTMTSQDTQRNFTTKTGPDGYYIIRGLPPGRYKLQFDTKGFAKLEYSDLVLILGKNLTINAPLTVASSAQEVIVT